MITRRLSVALAICLAALPAAPTARGADAPLPSARDVIVRGRTRLADALRLAVRGAPGTRTATSVTFVIDATPYVRDAASDIAEALDALETEALDVPAWRVARLGDRPGDAAPFPGALIDGVRTALAEDATATDTIGALRRTTGAVSDAGAAFVYLADWRFDDDRDLEALVDTLTRRGQRLSVVGGEAAFQRGWNDGFFAWRDTLRSGDTFDPRIGRAPFGPSEPEAPWHGGDTAYPHIPTHWLGTPWKTEFRPSLDTRRPEDLRERMAERAERAAMSLHPLPSSWGPYGLMRAAAVTGGRYVLWSWNPVGRSDVTYDYARCDQFPPDLRSRDAIRADVARRPLAKALNAAWHVLADPRHGIAQVTSPLDADHRRGREMDELRPSESLPFAWFEREHHRTFLRTATSVLADLDDVLARLDTAVRGAGDRLDDVDQRYLADTHLLRHVVAVQRFSLGEALAVARAVPDDAWDGDRVPCLDGVTFVSTGDDPDRLRKEPVPLQDPARGDAVFEDRKALLRRHRGTPFGDAAARNVIQGWRLSTITPSELGKGPSRTPAESGDPQRPPLTPPGGGSSGTPGSGTGR